MIRIIYLVRRAGGGMQSHVIGLLSELDRSRYEPFVISPDAPKLFEFLTEANIPCAKIDIKDAISPKADLIAARRVTEQTKRFKPEIVHIHGNKAAVVGWIARHIYNKPRHIVTVHNYPSNLNSSLKNRLISQRANKIVLNNADRLIAVSADIQRCLEKEIGVEPSKIRCIHNGIDSSYWAACEKRSKPDLRRENNLPVNSFLLGVVGRMVSFKAHNVLIDSMCRVVKAHPFTYLFMIGDGPLYKNLVQQVDNLNLQNNVRFLGFVDNPDRYLAGMDLFAFPSVREPFGIALLEAMAMGLPVVAAKAGGVPEIIEDGISGLLATPGDDRSLANCIERIIKDSELRERLAKNGRQHALDSFSIKTMAEKTQKTYEELA